MNDTEILNEIVAKLRPDGIFNLSNRPDSFSSSEISELLHWIECQWYVFFEVPSGSTFSYIHYFDRTGQLEIPL